MSAEIHLFASYQSSKELIESIDRFDRHKRGVDSATIDFAAIEAEIANALWNSDSGDEHYPEKEPA